ncbi:MAG TPA: toll/interleukin-1 receptor domain-containing protein, partial [Pyrinomonadaceae bacterium]|nr:toll/interleukin-1 receptor domain-containing protein [Pyrinomonadaceae bacterium]
AKWLHKSLETYRVPRKLVGRKGPHGEIPRSLFPIFRDRDELPGASDLGGKIKEALTQSRTLIVICSPKSAASKWVNEEVKSYKSLGSETRVLCLVVDGEPNATEKPESGLLECFPPAVRFRVAGNELTDQPAEPIAADARPGKDGKPNALFKLISGVLGVGYDELRQREKQRQKQRRMRMIALAAGVVLLVSVAYLAVADAGLRVPGGAAIRTYMDRNDISVMRHAHSNAEIREAASAMRRDLIGALKAGRTKEGGVAPSLKPGDKNLEHWSNVQGLTALFAAPDLTEDDARMWASAIEIPFAPGAAIEAKNGRKFGWMAHPNENRTQAEPAMWTAAALASALGRPGLLTGEARERAMKNLGYTHEVLKIYRPNDNGGWNMFPNQDDPSLHNVYTTTLALLALLETRKANLPWDGSVEKRDQLLKATAQWLADKFDDKARQPGWRTTSEIGEETIDGLTLQIYGELLRAEAEAGFVIPAHILAPMTEHLAKTGERAFSFPNDGGEFSAPFTDHSDMHYVAREALGFLWYPWAINAAQLWLLRAEKTGERIENQVRVRRALGHLVVNLGDEAVQKFKSEWTFQAAETLYGLSSIPQK